MDGWNNYATRELNFCLRAVHCMRRPRVALCCPGAQRHAQRPTSNTRDSENEANDYLARFRFLYPRRRAQHRLDRHVGLAAHSSCLLYPHTQCASLPRKIAMPHLKGQHAYVLAQTKISRVYVSKTKERFLQPRGASHLCSEAKEQSTAWVFGLLVGV